MNRLLTVSILAVVAGCDASHCDVDQRYLHGLCYELDAPPADTPPADSTPPDAAFAHYGAVCSDQSMCGAPTDYCAVQPGQTMGYCTHTNCLSDPAVCPPGWGCLDLSVFQPGLPAICTKP